MKVKRFLKPSLLLLTAALLLTFCNSLLAQCHNGSSSKGKKVFGIAASDKFVTFQIVPPVGQPITLSVHEGEMARLHNLKDDQILALVPIIKGADNDTADFTLFRVTEDQQGNESAHELESVSANFNDSAWSKGESKVQIKLIAIEKPENGVSSSNLKKEPSRIQLAMNDGGDCCVTCDLTTVCGAAVCIPGCGSCHDPGVPALDCAFHPLQTTKAAPFDLGKHRAMLALPTAVTDNTKRNEATINK